MQVTGPGQAKKDPAQTTGLSLKEIGLPSQAGPQAQVALRGLQAEFAGVALPVRLCH